MSAAIQVRVLQEAGRVMRLARPDGSTSLSAKKIGATKARAVTLRDSRGVRRWQILRIE
jgi:hypothetical protein